MFNGALVVVSFAGLVASTSLHAANVDVSHALIRATTEGQGMGIGFVQLKAKEATTLVGAESPICDSIVLHGMKKEGIVLSMGRIDAVDLSSRRWVKLEPGGNHLMLMHLRYRLDAGATVPLTLHFVDKAGHTFTETAIATVTNEGVMQESEP
jgi:copper(I)-binding protein